MTTPLLSVTDLSFFVRFFLRACLPTLSTTTLAAQIAPDSKASDALTSSSAAKKKGSKVVSKMIEVCFRDEPRVRTHRRQEMHPPSLPSSPDNRFSRTEHIVFHNFSPPPPPRHNQPHPHADCLLHGGPRGGRLRTVAPAAVNEARAQSLTYIDYMIFTDA